MQVDRLTLVSLVRAGFRRSRWQSFAGVLVAMVVTAAVLCASTVLAGMDRALTAGLSRLGADIIIAPPGQQAVVEQLLRDGEASPLVAAINVADAKKRIRDAKVFGILTVTGWSLAEGGAGKADSNKASILLVRLEDFASPVVARFDLENVFPNAQVITAEMVTRNVGTSLKPLVRAITVAAIVALAGAVLMIGLLTSIRVAERRAELGMLRAVGASRAAMVGLTLAETGVATLLGAAVGLVIGFVILLVLPQSVAERVSLADRALYGAVAVGVTFMVAALAALGPAFRAARMDPLEAARRGV